MNEFATPPASTAFEDVRQDRASQGERIPEFVPPVPESLDEAGLSWSTVEQLLIKTM